MRVISGKARGVNLKTPEGVLTRPTIDRVKEALFSIINFDIPTSNVLDLFGGTGQLGIEALSRGAKSAVFVDQRGRLQADQRKSEAHQAGTGCESGSDGLSRLPEAVQGEIRYYFPGPALCGSFSGNCPKEDNGN